MGKKVILYSCLVLLMVMVVKFSCFAQTSPTINPSTTVTFQLGSLFKDHMILQRDQPIPVWGKAEAGTAIIVQFANSKKQTVADSTNNWRVNLNAQKASFEPKELLISTGEKNIKISDVLVGDVWICSGQSNMQWPVGSVPEVKELITLAKNIRSFEVKNTVAFQPQDTCGGVWKMKFPNSAVAFSFTYFLEQSANVPIGIILTSWGSSSIEAWMPRDMIEKVPHFKTMIEEFDADTSTQNRIAAILDGPKPWPKKDDFFLRRQSNILYNAMMHPLIPYACKGIVWYQGERNTKSMHGMPKEPWFARNSGMLKYGETLKKWIERYRKGWENEALHFIIVMLPGFGRILDSEKDNIKEHPNSHSWAWMRESQLKALELPYTSVVNTIDLGDVKNIHPKDKLPVGKRSALLALHDVFNKEVKAHGPMLESVEINEKTIQLHFVNAMGLKTTDGKAPTGFWVSDVLGNWFPASAKIKGNKILLSTPELERPLYVRYAFTGKPNVNLVNEANLPAYPFRTDSFQP